VIKGPGLHGSVDTSLSLIDLYPTLIDLAGLPPPAESIQGLSLIRNLERRAGQGS
jgi:arylsulfatase A-like enzyme